MDGWEDTSQWGYTDTFINYNPTSETYSLLGYVDGIRTFSSAIKEYNALEIIEKMVLKNYIGDSPFVTFKTYRTEASIQYIKDREEEEEDGE